LSASSIVLDASVAIAVIRREPTRQTLLGVLRETAAGRGDRMVPDHFWLELANVLIRRYGVTAEEAVERLRDVDDFGLRSIRVDRPLLLVTLDLQARFGLSAYDAAYLALAETEDARLLTLDRRLALAAGARAVRLPGLTPERLAEEPEAYGEPVDWARFGGYLARLRAETRAMAAPEQ
jgi:predicted nucleic acid-binding protein